MKPICVQCQRFYRPKKNDFPFVEGYPNPSDTKPGKADPAGWHPYKLWNGDLWECPDCSHQIVVGCARVHESEHYMEDFADRVKARGVTLQVNDS